MASRRKNRCQSRPTVFEVAGLYARLICCAVTLCVPAWIVVSTAATAQDRLACVQGVSWTDPPLAAPPVDVCGTSSNTDATSFYTLSWELFKFLVWPASNERGKPDTTKKITDAGPRTFETLKTDWETFLPDARRPADWNVYPSVAEPCSNHTAVGPGALVLASFNKFGILSEVFRPGLDNFLVAQNRTYVRYLAGYNETVFSKIQNEGLYDADVVRLIPGTERGKPVPDRGRVDDGALIVKSAWIELPTEGPNHIDPSRFYVRDDALIQELDSGECRIATVGLVGLHVVYKTPSRPQWIWSTFEHVDNVPEADQESGRQFTFNNGHPTDHQTTDPEPDFQIPRPDGFNGPGVPPRAFQVERLQQIQRSVLIANEAQQGALGSLGSVWQNYKLVMTQWPGFPFAPNRGADAFPQPPCSARNGLAAVNTTMETFHQTQSHCFLERTCMGCHEVARKTDFVFSITLHPHHRPGPPTLPAVPDSRALAIRQLQDFLQLGK
jgi:hypothetical protein